jgi:hypothetical protein
MLWLPPPPPPPAIPGLGRLGLPVAYIDVGRDFRLVDFFNDLLAHKEEQKHSQDGDINAVSKCRWPRGWP